jgi:Fe-S-cluster containining protein
MRLDVINSAQGSEPWFADGLEFSCTGCGNCCTGGPGYIWINQEELARLAKFLGLGVEQVLDRYCRWIGQRASLNEVRTVAGLYDCVFLKEVPVEAGGGPQVIQPRRICTIYPVRPLQCRTWPFWEGNLASPEGWERASHRCPGIGQGRRHARADIEQLRAVEP